MTQSSDLTIVGMGLLKELEEAGAINAVGFNLTYDYTYEQFDALVAAVGFQAKWTRWAVGDLVNYGERLFGEVYAQLEAATGLSEKTVRNYASIAKAIPKERRRHLLPFSFHDAVTKFEPAEQEYWLERAEKERWTREDMRNQLNGTKSASGTEVVEVEVKVCECCGQML